MFCPSCKDEFRPGFTHCQSCDVDLVEDLSSVPAERAAADELDPTQGVALVDYCGFFVLDDARQARERLKAERISSDIVIRENPRASEQNPHGEEYWLRVDAAKYRLAASILGFDGADVS